MKREISSRDWFGKGSAGVICGFLIGVGISALFRALADPGNALYSLEGQFSVTLVNPVWAVIVGCCFMFTSTRRAWGWLGLASGLVWALAITIRSWT